MSTHQTLKRLAKIEARLLPSGDGSFTLKELCRAVWRRDKKRFRRHAESCRIYRFLFLRSNLKIRRGTKLGMGSK